MTACVECHRLDGEHKFGCSMREGRATRRIIDHEAFRTVMREPTREERDRVRMLLTHPHDGHGEDDTCLDCSAQNHTDGA